MIVAVEDVLSEVILRRLLAHVRPDLDVGVVIGRRGRDFLKKKARDLNRTAQNTPVIIVVDLDELVPCPADLVQEFLRAPPSRHLLFRVAVMEIESWIIADRDAFAVFLGVPIHRIPGNTDSILHPKEFLVKLARRSPLRSIREDLVPEAGGTATVGRAFNARLAAFVANSWSVSRATHGSPSLRRTVERLRQTLGRLARI